MSTINYYLKKGNLLNNSFLIFALKKSTKVKVTKIVGFTRRLNEDSIFIYKFNWLIINIYICVYYNWRHSPDNYNTHFSTTWNQVRSKREEVPWSSSI